MTNPDRPPDIRATDPRTARLWRNLLRAVLPSASAADAIDAAVRDQLRQVLPRLDEWITASDDRKFQAAIHRHYAYGDGFDTPAPDDPPPVASTYAQPPAPVPAPAYAPAPSRAAPTPPRCVGGSAETARAETTSERLGLMDLRSLLTVSPDAARQIIDLCAIIEGVQALRSRPPFDQEWDKGLQIVGFITCASRLMYEIAYGHWPTGPERAGSIHLVASQFKDVLEDRWRIEAYVLIAETEREFDSDRHERDDGRTGVGLVEPLTLGVLDRKTGIVAVRAVVRPSIPSR